MPENKTKATKSSVDVFLNKIKDTKLRDDCISIVDMMKSASKCDPVMWGSAIVGFGSYHYVHESGREGDTIIIGFAPRKQNIAIYLAGGVGSFESELAKLGQHETGKGCLYIKSMSDVNPKVLEKIFAKSFKVGQQRAAKAG